MENETLKPRTTPKHGISTFSAVVLLMCALACLTNPIHAETCGGELTGSYGVVVSPNYPQTYPPNVLCLWHIHPNATQTTNSTETGVSLDFRSFQTREGSPSTEETLRIYTTNPINDSSTPFRQYRGKIQASADRTLSITTSEEVWIQFRSSSTLPTAGDEPLGFRIVYLANGAHVQCPSDPLVHGSITNDSSSLTLQSSVRFQCDWGYRMEGSDTGVCRLDMGGVAVVSPRWSNVPKCLSTCLAPASITNGTYVTSGAGLDVNSTVTYSCDAPYLLDRPDPTITCTLSVKGTPQWNHSPPSCSVPNCHETIYMTTPTGTLVNPSFPARSELGGIHCHWHITVQRDMAVNFNISYLDLPPTHDAQILFQDLDTSYVYLTIHGNDGELVERSFNLSSDNVQVVYNSASANSSVRQGFYITYRTVQPSGPFIIRTLSTSGLSTTSSPIMTSSHHGGPSTDRHVGDNSDDNSDDDNSAGKIAGGVVAALIALILVAAGVGFYCYRKKYPVRMTVGRSFGKFSNPEYSAPMRASTLIREDAQDYFEHQMQPESHSQVNFILGGDEEGKVEYVNKAFEYDSQDADEEEVERRFRERKSYLFKRDEDETDSGRKRRDSEDRRKKRKEGEGRQGEGAETDEERRKAKKSKENGRAGGHENEGFVDSDAESVSSSAASDGSAGVTRKVSKKAGDESSDAESAHSADRESRAKRPPRAKDRGQASAEDNQATANVRSASLSATDGLDSPAMTVKEFLARMAREKRTNSDVSGAPRSGSLTSFDLKKSARRRAQSAGDIWDTLTVSAPELSKIGTEGGQPSGVPAPPLSGVALLDNSVENLNELTDKTAPRKPPRKSSSESLDEDTGQKRKSSSESLGEPTDEVTVGQKTKSSLESLGDEVQSRESKRKLSSGSKRSSVESESVDEATARESERRNSSGSQNSHDYINVDTVTGHVRLDTAPDTQPVADHDARERRRSGSSSASSSSEEEEVKERKEKKKEEEEEEKEEEEEFVPLPPRDHQVVLSANGPRKSASQEAPSSSSEDEKSDQDSDHLETSSPPKKDTDPALLSNQTPPSHAAYSEASQHTAQYASDDEDSIPVEPVTESLEMRQPPVGAEDASPSNSFIVLSSTEAGQSESKDHESISSEDTDSSIESPRTSSGTEYENYSISHDVPQNKPPRKDSDHDLSNRHAMSEDSDEGGKYMPAKPHGSEEDLSDTEDESPSSEKGKIPREDLASETRALPSAETVQRPREATKKRAVAVEGLTSVAYSDGSSPSSSSSESDDDDSDKRKDSEEGLPPPVPTSPVPELDSESDKDEETPPTSLTLTKESSKLSEQHEPQTIRFTPTTGIQEAQTVTSPERPGRLQFVRGAGDLPSARVLQLGPSSPDPDLPRPRGLAALRMLRATQPSSDASERTQSATQPSLGTTDRTQSAIQPSSGTTDGTQSATHQGSGTTDRTQSAIQPSSGTTDGTQSATQQGSGTTDRTQSATQQGLGTTDRTQSAIQPSSGTSDTTASTTRRASDSDSDDLELTDEDIARALVEGGEVSSDEEDLPPPLPRGPPPEDDEPTIVKLQPSEMFVFDHDDDDEDIDV